MARGESIDRGSLTGAINAWQERGLTQTGAKAELRGAGLGIRDSVFGQVWREILGARTRAADIADLPGQHVVPDALHTEWRAGTEGRYAYQLNVMVQDHDGGDIYSMPYMVVSDNPMSPNDALSAAIDEVNANIGEQGAGYNQSAMGAMLVGAYLMTGRP